MSDVSREPAEREPTTPEMLRLILRALSSERLGEAALPFGRRAIGAALMSSVSGAFAGFLPAFVAIGVAGLSGGSTPRVGVFGALSGALAGAPAWASVAVSLALVAIAVSLGFAASRTSAHFSTDVSAALRVAMMKRVLATSPRALSETGNAIGAPKGPSPTPGMAASRGPGPAPPGARVAPLRSGGGPQAPGADAIKLAVLRDGQMASELLVATLTNLPQALFGLVALVVDVSASGSPMAALLGIGIFLLSRVFAGRASKNVSAASADLSRADAVAFAEVGEKIAHLDDLRLAGAQKAALAEVDAAVALTRDKRRAVARAVAVSGQTSSLVATLAPLVVLLSFSLTGQQVSPSEIARLLLALPLIIGRLGAVDALRVAAVEKRPVLSSVCAVLGLPAHPPRSSAPVRLADLPPSLSIDLEGVGFQPPGSEKPILSDVSFSIPAGSVVALAGSSGSGKSTLLRLLLRLDDPTSGRILVGGVELASIEPDDLPALFGALAQGGKLLARTVEENVTLSLGAATPESRTIALRALNEAQIADLASEAGLARRFQAAPANLSGGEQRRVLLARALAQPASILVLDEPEAGLPKATARAMFEAVLDARGKRTVIVVTHAPALLRSTCTVVLQAGRVVDIGSHDDLVGRCEVYRTITESAASDVDG